MSFINHSQEPNRILFQERRRQTLLLTGFSVLLVLCLSILVLSTTTIAAQDVLGVLLGLCVPALFVVFALVYGSLPWNGKIIFFLLLGYYSLFVGFAYLRIKVGLPIYIGEVGMLLLLLLTRHRADALRCFLREPICWLSLFWILSALPSFTTSILIHPTNSLRNFSPAYYTVFIYFGYMFMVNSRKPLEVWQIYGRTIFLILWYYALMLPVRHSLAAISPEVAPGIPLLGYFPNGFTYAFVFGAFGLMLAPHLAKYTKWVQYISFFVMFEALVVTQARSALLQIPLLAMLLWGLRKYYDFKKLRRLVGVGFLVTLFLIVGASGFGINFEGEKGPLSLSFYRTSTLSIFGVYDSDYRHWTAGEGMVSSAFSRAEWWKEVVLTVFDSVDSAVFGLGFHQTLGSIPGINAPVQFMNAHGTFATILGRFGLFGLLPCLGIVVFVLVRVFQGLRQCKQPAARAVLAWLIVAFILFIFGGFWGTWFDSPNHAISFYLLIGFALGFVQRTKFGAM